MAAKFFSQSISFTTASELGAVKRQRAEFETKMWAMFKGTEDPNDDPDIRTRIKYLRTWGPTILPRIPAAQFKFAAENYEHFSEQSRYDPSVSKIELQKYEWDLQSLLHIQSNKSKAVGDADPILLSRPASKLTCFAKGRYDEMRDQRASWERCVFAPKETDAQAIRAYLQKVFSSSKESTVALETMVTNIKLFQEEWDAMPHFKAEDVRESCKAVLRSGGIYREIYADVKELLRFEDELDSHATGLRFASRRRFEWCWVDTPQVEARRDLIHDKWRFHVRFGLFEALFIDYYARRWAVKLREEFMTFVKTAGVWKSDTKPVSSEDARRRRFFLLEFDKERDKEHTFKTVDEMRQDYFNNVIFLNRLPRAMDDVRVNYQYSEYEDPPGDAKKTYLDVEQELIHRIQAEVLLQTRMGKDITVMRANFRSFSASLPHSSIFAVLDFFGFDDVSQYIFRSFLEAPMVFKDDTKPQASRIRKRGTPRGSILANFLEEALLFCLDFAVNQAAEGAKLYRLHDDMWLLGDADTYINKEKTGSVTILRRDKSPRVHFSPEGVMQTPLLPRGDVVWGFLKLQRSTGRFTLDRSALTEPISDFRYQFKGCRSVFDLVRLWNGYVGRFFAHKFGAPANCFSRRHIVDILYAFQRIQQQLFPRIDGSEGVEISIPEFLREKIKKATDEFLPVGRITDGFLYFPRSRGGLGLHNPFIQYLLVKGSVVEDADKEIIDAFLRDEERAYRAAKDYFEDPIMITDPATEYYHHEDLTTKPFMSFEEFTRYREQTSSEMAAAYKKLIQRPVGREKYIERSGDVWKGVGEEEWHDMSAYDRWAVQVYHSDMLDRYGGFRFFNWEDVPEGLRSLLRESGYQYLW
ncbi:hypothetical protein V8F20_007775 [Naviculisporaceae sp. PSN 640]